MESLKSNVSLKSSLSKLSDYQSGDRRFECGFEYAVDVILTDSKRKLYNFENTLDSACI